MIAGYKLVDEQENVVQSWGGIYGQTPGIPNPLDLPNGDQVHAAQLNTSYDGYQLIVWEMDPPAPTQLNVDRERDRRLALGFDYDFTDDRGVHNIGTTPSDMIGWSEVTTLAQSLINIGSATSPMNVVTNTGSVVVTALEWQHVLIAAAAFREPIWQKSFELGAMTPIPADYASDDHWVVSA